MAETGASYPVLQGHPQEPATVHSESDIAPLTDDSTLHNKTYTAPDSGHGSPTTPNHSDSASKGHAGLRRRSAGSRRGDSDDAQSGIAGSLDQSPSTAAPVSGTSELNKGHHEEAAARLDNTVDYPPQRHAGKVGYAPLFASP